MKCIRCGKEVYESTASEAIEHEKGLLVVRNIPCYKCSFCDEVHIFGDSMKRIEMMIEAAGNLAEEIIVVDYEEVA